MAELTPERIRDAAEVVELLYGNTNIAASGNNLRAAANKLACEQAEKAKRGKRIEELAREMYSYFHPGCMWVESPQFIRAATKLLDAYPALADTPGQKACNCGNENDASWCDDECASRSASR